MSFKRLFQDSDGEIESLKGTVLTGIKYLYDNLSEKEDIILLWLRTDKDTWLRIFIDGSHCGIDEYLYDESACNLEENMSIVDYSKWIMGTKIITANSECTELPEITLTINLSNHKRIVFACNKDESCSIKFLSTDV